jgi:hypothetical protein
VPSRLRLQHCHSQADAAAAAIQSVRPKLHAWHDAHRHQLLEQQLARVRHEHLQQQQQQAMLKKPQRVSDCYMPILVSG